MYFSQLFLLSLAFSFSSVVGDSSTCFSIYTPLAALNTQPGFSGPVNCSTIGPSSSRNSDACFLACLLCATPELSVSLDPSSGVYSACTSAAPAPPAEQIYVEAAQTVYNMSIMHGYFWLDDAGDVEANATEALLYLISYMPRRDLIMLARNTFTFADFLVEHVRFALQTRAWSASVGITWDLFLNSVLPYAIFDEKHDLEFRWRPRFYQLFAPLVAGQTNVTAVMELLAAAIPSAAPLGALAMINASAPGGETTIPGRPVTWRSEVSPAFISPQQVASFGGSCTGTAIVLVAAARSIGIPARIAGCSESVVRGDDHHWSEFLDPAAPGPFGDYWHTKEGTSAGNAGGPWDSPSGPMLGCLQGVVPGSSLDTLWAVSYDSPVFLPALWANSSWSQTWSFVGGENRCGAYCIAWGCGVNNSIHYTQAQCGPAQ